MQTREWFIMGVRLLGLFVIFTSLTYFSYYIEHLLGHRSDSFERPVSGYLVHGCVHFLFGLYLLFGTKHLARMAYGELADQAKPDSLEPLPEVRDGNHQAH